MNLSTFLFYFTFDLKEISFPNKLIIKPMKAQNNQANSYFKEMAKQHNCTIDEFIQVYYN